MRFFGIVYALVWNAGVGSVNLLWGLIFGAVHGVVVVVVMPIMMNVHPRHLETESGSMAIVGQLMGHEVFGPIVALVYAAF